MRKSVRAGVFLVAACLAGCSGSTGGVGPAMEPQEALVKELGELLRSGSGNFRNVNELAPFSQQFPRSFAAVKSGELVVLWGTPMMGEGDAGKGAGVIVAHEKGTAASGGWVLFTNGTVRKLSASEFGSAKKGGKG